MGKVNVTVAPAVMAGSLHEVDVLVVHEAGAWAPSRDRRRPNASAGGLMVIPAGAVSTTDCPAGDAVPPEVLIFRVGAPAPPPIMPALTEEPASTPTSAGEGGGVLGGEVVSGAVVGWEVVGWDVVGWDVVGAGVVGAVGSFEPKSEVPGFAEVLSVWGAPFCCPVVSEVDGAVVPVTAVGVSKKAPPGMVVPFTPPVPDPLPPAPFAPVPPAPAPDPA